MSTPTHVLIIGAGVGGLALAQGLQKSGIPYTVFERDPGSNYRAQGYRLKINGDGANALKAVLTNDDFQYFQDTCAESFPGETNINALDGSILASRAGAGSRPGPVPYLADRTVLRDILLRGVKDKIVFGKQLSRYEEVADGVVAHFTDGTSQQGSLIVGADGVHSAVRKQYQPNHRPIDTNGTCIYGKTPMTEQFLQTFPARALKWMTLILDRTPMTQTLDIDETPVTLLMEPVRFVDNVHRGEVPEDYVYWVLISRSNIFAAARKELVASGNDESAYSLCMHMTQEWDPSIKSLFALQDRTQASMLNISSAKPQIPHWTASERVVLLGDAVHVMSPCGGVGAVTALKDAATLLDALVKQGSGVETIDPYETKMREYARSSIERSYMGGKKMFGQPRFDDCPYIG
ncbi:cercosporin toxin biosynthesis protein [Aureobasidium namibiae CBS 147.97]|uniref:Cercosporin toxin biosynthesis protein n=1 Tax=Aureobasidium namibiae CBS 147.97 TaxID=1043004 RepID=A0A074WM38_9PEZI